MSQDRPQDGWVRDASSTTRAASWHNRRRPRWWLVPHGLTIRWPCRGRDETGLWLGPNPNICIAIRTDDSKTAIRRMRCFLYPYLTVCFFMQFYMYFGQTVHSKSRKQYSIREHEEDINTILDKKGGWVAILSRILGTKSMGYEKSNSRSGNGPAHCTKPAGGL